MAPKVGLEPTTNRLTAGCSTTELLRNAIIELQFIVYYLNHIDYYNHIYCLIQAFSKEFFYFFK